MLIVDACVRGADSYTRKYYSAYLQMVNAERTLLDLSELALTPLDGDLLKQRERLCREGRFVHEVFALARQFRDAEEILIAAPYWDLSFPAILKVYLERISVSGVTFTYDASGRCVGLCRAKRLLYFSTCGGYCGERNLGFEYVKAFSSMLGIGECVPYLIEGMDVEPDRREDILAEAIIRLQSKLTKGKR